MGLAWAPQGQEIWFTASRSTANYLQAVDLRGNVRTLFRGVTDLELCDTDASGRALVISSDRRYLVKLVTPGAAAADVSVMDASAASALSADGKEVAVGEENDGRNYSTFLRATKPDADPVRLGDGEPLGISPDGRWVISDLPTSPRQLLLLPTGVGQQRQLTHGDISFPTAHVGWMPDGRSFVAIGGAPGQLGRSFLVDLQGHVRPVTPPGVQGFAVAPDGRSLLVFTGGLSQGHFELYPLLGGAPTPLPALHAGDRPMRFDGSSMVEVTRFGAPGSGIAMEVYQVNLRTGSRVLVTQVGWPDGAGVAFGLLSSSVSADGKTASFSYLRELSTLGLFSGLR